jgi:hypothetical protein
MIGDVSGSDRRRLLRDGDRPSSCNDAAHAPSAPRRIQRPLVLPAIREEAHDSAPAAIGSAGAGYAAAWKRPGRPGDA